MEIYVGLVGKSGHFLWVGGGGWCIFWLGGGEWMWSLISV